MPSDLTTLDVNTPHDTSPAKDGASVIRDYKARLIESFDVEHHLDGTHTFPYTDPSGRGAVGHPGALFFDANHGRAEIDDGSFWKQLHTVQEGHEHGVTSLSTGVSGAYSAMNFVAFNIAKGAIILIHSCIEYVLNTNGTIRMTTRFRVDGTPAVPETLENTFTVAGSGVKVVNSLTSLALGIAAGDHIVTVEATVAQSSGAPSSANRLLVVLAL